MSIHKLTSALAQRSQQAGAATPSVVVGEVETYNPNNYTARVWLQPEGILTGYLPIKSMWLGSGWGMFSPPSSGDLVAVAFEGGDIESGMILGGLNSSQQAPLSVNSGEFWLVHQSGASVKLTNSGAVSLADGQGATISMSGGAITSTGPWSHTGTFTATGEGTFNGHTVSNHTHGGVAVGSRSTQTPTG